MISIRTLGLEELKLAVEELKVRLGEDDFRNVFLAGTRASTDVARLSHGIAVVNDLHLRGVDVLCRHCVVLMSADKQRDKLIKKHRR